MPPFQNFLASCFSLTNENTAAVISAKLDFSLFKVEAPSEFAPVGPALSPLRRQEAEIGPVHRTARRLAALFEDIVPSTPNLVAAYGKRVSSIISRPHINPQGSSNDGPFRSFVGADGTAIWAAATSGNGAIAVYLLASLLARAWDSNNAISIWVELIQIRVKEIINGFERGEHTRESSLMSTLQEISREELAIWDASARSWLRSADQAEKIRMKQLELVTKDLGLEFPQGPSTYNKVIETWKQAMSGIEDLLKGLPQQISDASILLAFSAWHLFPDLVVLADRPTNVPFRDKLFPGSGVGTIGLSPADESKVGIQWSLALSHLQYYGAPVEVCGQASQPRVSFLQFRLVALGCLFFKWRLNRRDFIPAAKFLSGLWELLLQNDERPSHIPVIHQFRWLYVFVQASNDLLLSKSLNISLFDEYRRLIEYGHRRGRDFFVPEEESVAPFFGICNKHVIESMKAAEDTDCAIDFLRSVAQASGLGPREGIILCGHWENSEDSERRPSLYEFATICQHQIAPENDDYSGDPIAVSARWFEIFKADGAAEEVLHHRQPSVVAKGEMAILQNTCEEVELIKDNQMWWINAPKLFSSSECIALHRDSPSQHDHTNAESVGCECFTMGPACSFRPVIGSWKCGLFLIKITKRANLLQNIPVDPLFALEALRLSAHRGTLWSYMSSLVNNSYHLMKAADYVALGTSANEVGITLVSASSRFSSRMCRALHSLAVADIVFEPINVPTISLECLSLPLHEAKWGPTIEPRGAPSTANCLANGSNDEQAQNLDIYSRMHTPIPALPGREKTFACMIFFDSGSIDIPPEELGGVLAVSAGNSIYVAGVILSDPAVSVPDHQIRHITGNIGRRGISLLVAPRNAQIRSLSNDWTLAKYETYNCKREDNFKDTSLHLSFTNWRQALSVRESSRTIDQEVYFIESVISVREKGVGVADLDILAIDFDSVIRLNDQTVCTCKDTNQQPLDSDFCSIDSWEELLDDPPTTAIVRAHGNWAARLAALSILFQRQQGHCVGIFGRESFCLICMERERFRVLGSAGGLLQDHESSLPQFCID
jgi:hypothetical protein